MWTKALHREVKTMTNLLTFYGDQLALPDKHCLGRLASMILEQQAYAAPDGKRAQRKEVRAQLVYACEIQAGDENYDGTLLDVGLGGLRLHSEVHLCMGTDVTIKFHPYELKMKQVLSGVIRWRHAGITGIEFTAPEQVSYALTKLILDQASKGLLDPTDFVWG